MDHNQIQKAIDEYNRARQEALDTYTRMVTEQQKNLLNAIAALQVSNPQHEVDEGGNVTLSKVEADALYQQLEVANDLIKKHPELIK